MSNRFLIKETDWIFPECATRPIIFCPECGGGLLGEDAPHEICENGDVNNSVVCRHPDCTFHKYVTLENWKGGHIARQVNTFMPGDKANHFG